MLKKRESSKTFGQRLGCPCWLKCITVFTVAGLFFCVVKYLSGGNQADKHKYCEGKAAKSQLHAARNDVSAGTSAGHSCTKY